MRSIRYLCRWKSHGMLFFRWTFCVGDSVIRRDVEGPPQRNKKGDLIPTLFASNNEYMLLHKANGARFEVPYNGTVFLFSKKRSKVIEKAMAECK